MKKYPEINLEGTPHIIMKTEAGGIYRVLEKIKRNSDDSFSLSLSDDFLVEGRDIERVQLPSIQIAVDTQPGHDYLRDIIDKLKDFAKIASQSHVSSDFDFRRNSPLIMETGLERRVVTPVLYRGIE